MNTTCPATGDFSSLKCAVVWFNDIISGSIIPFIISLAILVFIFGLFKYITAGGDEEQLKTARDFIIYGIIFIAVMISVWGLVNLVVRTFFPTTDDLYAPQIAPLESSG